MSKPSGLLAKNGVSSQMTKPEMMILLDQADSEKKYLVFFSVKSSWEIKRIAMSQKDAVCPGTTPLNEIFFINSDHRLFGLCRFLTQYLTCEESSWKDMSSSIQQEQFPP